MTPRQPSVIVTFMSKRASCEINETVDSMDRQPLYFTILILSILIGSSFYLSWAVDRGMGEVSVEKLSIESAPGRSVELLVYSPRTANHYEPMPVVLTLHGLSGSKEGMYSFNVELARRNFTVVSIDLPGHGDSSSKFSLSLTWIPSGNRAEGFPSCTDGICCCWRCRESS
ncbi:MAG: alpha/beta hydrolase [Candidatus Thorarchaeota archaeon]